jgi:Uma2 family endonuclease
MTLDVVTQGASQRMTGLEQLCLKPGRLLQGAPIRLVAEVVSTNWQDDDARKVEEYALLQIPEYWIVDFAGLGGTAFIGKPKQPTLTICHLVGEDYNRHRYGLRDTILSNTFPELRLSLENLT